MKMADKQGTDDDALEGCSGWYFVSEAECSQEDEPIEKLFDRSDSESNISDLVDDAAVEQGNSLELYQRQTLQTGLEQILQLKRKFVNSPQETDVAALSPQLAKIFITPKKVKKVKKVLFEAEDSGIGGHEATGTSEELQVETSTLQVHSTPLPGREQQNDETEAEENSGEKDKEEATEAGPETAQPLSEGLTGRAAVQMLMKSINRRATILCKFKEAFHVSFVDLTRSFRSNKTMSKDWCIAIFGVSNHYVDMCKELMKEHCKFLYLENFYACGMGLLELKNSKCRDTMLKLLKSTMKVEEVQVLAEPPRTASTVSALFWYRRCCEEDSQYYGELPQWLVEQTSLQHRLGYERPFDLSEMIQWAFDNDYHEEPEIAYNYAILADINENARAFLKNSSQAKIVKDVCTMIRYYRRAEMRGMSISSWIHYRCAAVKSKEEDAWKQIVNFLRFQGIPVFRFIGALQKFLKNEPKKSCLVFYGPPNTGKSLLAMSFVTFLKGRVLTFANSQSQFWLQPLLDAKVALIDDATMKCWQYFDVYLRGALDGNSVCIDAKHRAPSQVKFPPMIITTNIDVQNESSLKFLMSRLKCFNFPEILPICATGEPRYQLNDKSWQAFFARFWDTLQLSEQESDEDGSSKALRLHSGSNARSL